MCFLSVKALPMAVLGISTNTRLLGTAIINEGQLTAYRIRLFKASWSPSKATQIITSLEPCVQEHCIKRVVLSIPPRHHQTREFQQLALMIEEYFLSHGIAFSIATREKILSVCTNRGRKTKRALMQSLCTRFPELAYCSQKELRNKTKYYHKLFEAVAAANT